jgi:flagellar biosynthetic protein FlhB
MASENKTEQPTPRRRQKAREKGQVVRSRELPATLALAGTLATLAYTSGSALEAWRNLMRSSLYLATRSELRISSPLLERTAESMLLWLAPVLGCGFALAAAGGVAQGGFVFAPALLQPALERLSPAKKLRSIFSSSGTANLLKSLLPFAAIAYCAGLVLVRDWSTLCAASGMSVADLRRFLASRALEVGWRSVLILLLWSALDYWLARQKFEGDLRMSRQEIRDEHKETEGNPTSKLRIRRLQRQVHRRRMLREVQQATVVVTNPTHFAVALAYRAEMAAPAVVAKGQNLLAQQIKEAARWHGIPVMENPPLAQALYRSAEVGQAIPAKLYVAVAELLAFVYRAQQQTTGRA